MKEKVNLIEYDIEEEIASIKWSMADIETLFSRRKIPFTDENIKIFFDNRVTRTLEEGSIAVGWDILNDILSSCEDEMNLT